VIRVPVREERVPDGAWRNAGRLDVPEEGVDVAADPGVDQGGFLASVEQVDMAVERVGQAEPGRAARDEVEARSQLHGASRVAPVGYHVVTPDELGWEERDRAADEPPRWHAPVTDVLRLEESRARMWRYSPGARGRRHKDLLQEEVFVVLEGELSAYMDDPPERVALPAGSVLAVPPGTPLQLRNESDADVRFFAYGAPPEQGGAEFLPDVQ
jgi:mannose-6-phosphate isomerase-like protein (cupin superfamily)